MHSAWVIFAAAALLGSSATFEQAHLPDDAHHENRHVDEDTAGHHHGDADDHHDSPDSPCHHHETQICTGHGHVFAVGVSISIVEPAAAQLFTPVTVDPSQDPSVHLIFHIPIA